MKYTDRITFNPKQCGGRPCIRGMRILTKDEDFAVRAKQSQNSPKVVWLQIGNCSNRALCAWLEPLLPAIVRQLEQGDRLLEIH